MEELKFEILINADPMTVHRLMLEDKTYREWTSAFNETSHYSGSWEKDSKIIFKGTDEKGNTGGMVSRIAENIPGKIVSIEHLGILSGDKEITSGPEVEGWKGAKEIYEFEESNGNTILHVRMDSNQEFKDYFAEIWPKALAKLKSICES